MVQNIQIITLPFVWYGCKCLGSDSEGRTQTVMSMYLYIKGNIFFDPGAK